MSSDAHLDENDRERLASECWRVMYQLVFESEGPRRIQEACAQTGLTPAMLRTLLRLDPRSPLPMRELVVAFHCDPSYVTALVDGLEAGELAVRRSHPRDRRVKVVELTAHGAAALSTALAILDAPPKVFTALGDGEVSALRELLGKLPVDAQATAW